jgi:CRP-like cAMP-binding protein
MSTLSNNARTLGRWLALVSDVDEDDLALLAAVPMRAVSYRQGAAIIRQGDRPTESCLLLDGYICREKQVEEGRRQILSIHLPGEMPDLQSLHLERMDHGMVALTASSVAFIPHAEIKRVVDEDPRLRAALWRASLVDASIFREWLAGVGARSADQRAAHLLSEVYFRARLLGFAHERAANVPLTRRELSEALGVSSVHVSRIVLKLRMMGTINVTRGAILIENWPKLKEFSSFDPTYLHLRAPVPEDLR